MGDGVLVGACKLVEEGLFPRISNEHILDIHKFIATIEEFSRSSSIGEETVYACVMRHHSYQQAIISALEHNDTYKHIYCKYLEPELEKVRRRAAIREYTNGRLDMDNEENKQIVVEYECQRLFQYIQQGCTPSSIKKLLPDARRCYDRRQTLRTLLHSCKEQLYHLSTPAIVAFLHNSIPVLRHADRTMFLLDRLVKDIKTSCGQKTDFHQSICTAVIAEITSSKNAHDSILIDKKDEQHAYLTCSIDDLHGWTPDPLECGDEPIAKGSKTGHFLSVLFSLFKAPEEFVLQYQLDLEKRILCQRSTHEAESRIYEKVERALGEEIMKPVFVMLSDWKHSESTGVLFRSIRYWPRHPSTPSDIPSDPERGRRQAFESSLASTIAVKWMPHLEPVSVILQFDNGAFEFVVPVSAFELLKRLIEMHDNNTLFTLDTNLHEQDIAVWMKHGVIGECGKGTFIINSNCNKQ